MILLELKRYIKQYQHVTLSDIQIHFDLSEEAALGLLDHLLQQGHVLALHQSSSCTTQICHSNCTKTHKTKCYQWVNSEQKPLAVSIYLK